MGNRLSKIYTRTGDDGTTGLGDGQRVSKNDARVEALREKARVAGLDMRVSLEAVVTFASREGTTGAKGSKGRRGTGRTGLEMSANDRRFLKSLRISADEAAEKEVE